jgi:hypothetical protein
VTKLLNAKYFIKIKHITRIFFNSIIMLCAFIIIAFACTYSSNIGSFYVALFSSVLFGIASALGESTTLGFCNGFPSEVVGYFGSGTGFAGIFGTGTILLLELAGFDHG